MTAALDHTALDTALGPLLEAPRWCIAFSGGLDSTVLLHLLLRWCAAHPEAPGLQALHVDHGLQAASGRWSGHCAGVAREWGVPCDLLRAQVEPAGLGLEAAAREARYQCLGAALQPGDILFTGHHLDDQVETFFLRLLRGAGLQGLAAMPPTRPLGLGLLVRPLLAYSRSSLEAYAREHGLGWVDDPSNTDRSLDRNYLRHEVLPLLEQRWPGYRRTVARAAGHLAEVSRTLGAADGEAQSCASPMGDPGLALSALTCEDAALAARRLREFLRSQALAAPAQAALDEFLRQLRDSRGDAAPKLETGSYRLQRFREGVYLLPESGGPPAQPLALGPGQSIELPGIGRVALEPATGPGLAFAPGEVPQLAWRRGGEHCRLAGRNHGVSLKQLLQEAGLPPWWRERVPLLYMGGELVAVGALGACAGPRWSAGGEPGQTRWQLVWEPAARSGFD